MLDENVRWSWLSNIDSGEAGSKGEAIASGAPRPCAGGERKGLYGETGDGVSGSQYDIGGIGGTSGSIMLVTLEEGVPG